MTCDDNGLVAEANPIEDIRKYFSRLGCVHSLHRDTIVQNIPILDIVNFVQNIHNPYRANTRTPKPLQ